MSRVYFHSPSGEAELRGSERAMMGLFINNTFTSMLDPYCKYDCESQPSIIRPLVQSGWWTSNFRDSFLLACNHEDITFTLGDKQDSAWGAALNTTLAIGNEPTKMMARIHGQCEIHAFLRGENRAWMADVIKQGRSLGVYRPNMGWETVAEFLRADSSEPVVMSYSVCEQFPNSGVAEWEDENDGDDWYDLPFEKRWSLAFDKLTDPENDRGLEIIPGEDYHFGNGTTAFEIIEYANSLKAAKVVK